MYRGQISIRGKGGGGIYNHIRPYVYTRLEVDTADRNLWQPIAITDLPVEIKIQIHFHIFSSMHLPCVGGF